MTVHRLNFQSPYGCRWCGLTQQGHMQRWSLVPGWHKWVPPVQEQILERMLARRAARLNAEPTLYHATTAWADDGSGESAEPYCADCKTPVCHRWSRIQMRLDQQRFGLPRRVRRSRKALAGGWGGDQPWPF